MSNPKTITEIQTEIQKLQDALDKARDYEERFNRLPLNQRVAIKLHDMTCTANHIDYCGWEYEINKGVHDFSKHTHVHYLEKAGKIIETWKANSMDTASLIPAMEIILNRRI